MSTLGSSRDIDDTASDWTARLDRGPLTDAEEVALEAWLQSDSRCRGALLRAQALSMKSEAAQALGPHFDPMDFAAPAPPGKTRISRRRALMLTGPIVAGAALIAFGVSTPAAGTTISTGRGELRLVPLRDGSTVMLNTDTSIRIRYGPNERHVTLLNGEAFFSVAPGAPDSLVVEVDGHRLTTAQAGFDVRKLGTAPVNVMVHQGQVRLVPQAWGDQHPVAISANTRVMLAESHLFQPSSPTQTLPVPADVVTRELAWMEGKIALEGETLQAAADEFARYSNTRIVIRGTDLAREPMTGLFAANDPAGFSRAAASVLNARVERDGDTIVLSRGTVSQR